MSEPVTPLDELHELTAGVLDGTITADRFDRLCELLRHDAQAQRFFVRYVDLHATLRRGIVRAPIAEAISATSPLVLSPIAPVAKSSFFRILRVASNSPLAATLVVATVLYGLFGYLAWDLHSAKQLSFAGGDNASVAVVCDTADVTWSKDTSSKSAQSPVLSGEPLKISSGTIELELNAGTKLVVEGPAEWSIDGENRATLRSGKLAARVTPQAIGFTLDTPTARIVDLGTEFGVEIAKGGVTEVQVFQGKIELHPNAYDDKQLAVRKPITLQAGNGIRLEPNGANGQPTMRRIAATPDRFTRQIGSANSRRLSVSGALASSEWPTCEVRHLTDGSGMRGDSHGAVGTDTMWSTMPGQNKNVFVLFDLGRPCRLESMKIWNYNDNFNDWPFYKSRGVKQADIYVSDTGEWDPLNHLDKWKLVVEDRQFSMADGTPNYASPDTIALGNVEARFVAIVIDEQFKPIRDGVPFEDHAIGLSEVQFFGERVLSSKKPATAKSPSK